MAVEPDFAPWRVVSVALFASGGVLITLLVEALHAARRRVEASQQWLTAVLTSIGDAVIATDAQGRVTFINPVARSLTGWESEQAVGRPLTDIFRIVTEDTRAPVENPVDPGAAREHRRRPGQPYGPDRQGWDRTADR